MASLKASRATNTVLTARFAKTIGLLVAGYIASVVVTGWMRDNVVDIGMAGGDAVYGVTAAALFLMLPIGSRNARFLAYGAGFGAGLTIYEEVF